MTELVVYYDFASPFCYVAHEVAGRLQACFPLQVTWRPFEVIDYLPERGAMPQNPAFVRRAEAASAVKLAGEYGMTIRLCERLLNSNLALCAVECARASTTDAARAAAVADRLRLALFEARYCHERDISDLSVVLELAGSCGLGGEVETALRDGAYRQRVAESRAAAQDLGVVAVPTWLVGDYGVVGVPAFSELVRLVETSAPEEGS